MVIRPYNVKNRITGQVVPEIPERFDPYVVYRLDAEYPKDALIRALPGLMDRAARLVPKLGVMVDDDVYRFDQATISLIMAAHSLGIESPLTVYGLDGTICTFETTETLSQFVAKYFVSLATLRDANAAIRESIPSLSSDGLHATWLQYADIIVLNVDD
jgi:hypothetical protein